MENFSGNEYLLKIAIIGSGSVGKTSLIHRYAEGTFVVNYVPTLGVDLTRKVERVSISERIGSALVTIIYVDTAGQGFFRKLRPAYYRGSHGCIIVFSLANRKSYENLPEWLAEIKNHLPDPKLPVIVIGNKSDLENERVVLSEAAEEYCNNNNWDYFETSAKLGINVNTAFKHMAKKCLFYELERIEKIFPKMSPKLSETQNKLLNPLKHKTLSKRTILPVLDYLDQVTISQETNLTLFIEALRERIEKVQKRKTDKFVKSLLLLTTAKTEILDAKIKESEGSQEVFIDKFVEGIKYYRNAVALLNIDVLEEKKLIQNIMTDIYHFFSRMISDPIDIDRFQAILGQSPEIREIGIEFGDRFYRFFEQCLRVRSSRSFQEYKALLNKLEHINDIFGENHPHKKLVNETYTVLLENIPPVLISVKTIFPDPPVFGESSILTLKLVNIQKTAINFRVDTVSSPNPKEKSERTLRLDSLEEREISIPLEQIKSTTVWIDFEIFLKKGKKYKYLYKDSYQTEVEKPKSPLHIHVQAPRIRKQLEKSSKIALSLFLFNYSPKTIETKVYIDTSWETDLHKYPSKNLFSRKIEQLDITLDLPKSYGNFSLICQFFSENGEEIPDTRHSVELIIEETKRGKFLRYIKGVGSYVSSIAEIIM